MKYIKYTIVGTWISLADLGQGRVATVTAMLWESPESDLCTFKVLYFSTSEDFYSEPKDNKSV